ncbi:MAG: family transcriptional regulator [Acidobacteria bacterium]|nr:family transcriptional regulator [Acidobacteriota bacterium]
MSEQDAQNHSELASFGEELRREREIRGISLKEIADATKISKRFLDAIERNDHRTLPAPVFTRGFVREYARYLGLNADEIVNRYNFAAAGDDRIEKTAHLERLVQPREPEPAAKPGPKKGIPPPYAHIDRNVFLLIGIIIALAAVAWWAVHHKRAAHTEAPEVLHPQTSVAPATAPPVTNPAPAPASTAAASPMPAGGLRLTVDSVGGSWVVLEADGKVVYSDELKRGEQKTFDAREEFRFRTIGNAGGVALTLNDTKLPSLGHEGQVVRDRVFDRETLRKVAGDSRSGR